MIARYVTLAAGSRQRVPSRSIAQHQINTFRAIATAAFFRPLFCPPDNRSNSVFTYAQ